MELTGSEDPLFICKASSDGYSDVDVVGPATGSSRLLGEGYQIICEYILRAIYGVFVHVCLRQLKGKNC